jgi:hypothetical protein
MSVPYQRISEATVSDVIYYDPAAERRASQMNVNWDDYFKTASSLILLDMEFSWWPQYCDNVIGANYYSNLPNGQLISAFNPNLLIKNGITLIRLDTFKAIETFYSSLVSDTSNVNSVDAMNFNHSRDRFSAEWESATQLSNWYDLYQDRPSGPTTKLEEGWQVDPDFMSGARRFF